ncbi:hypothetical protein O181_006996 [Austropuccinia psidii MF-1]|uniref:Major facilitator superfamily (MFS) profile domain-containing protein n=1 Tax=Austropuccinia psidii MF-1 TaxID=1389203 RepID=A0A9Q3BK17_9BASI|nr:hypothetical protein [Austropuccinia psidii MF-1]
MIDFIIRFFFTLFHSSPAHPKAGDSPSLPFKTSKCNDEASQQELKASTFHHAQTLSEINLAYNSNSNSSSTTRVPEIGINSTFGSSKELLPPVDTGREAWKYLFAMFILELAIWGFAGSYGVLLDFYLHSKLGNEPASSFILPLVGTINTGIMATLMKASSALGNLQALKEWKFLGFLVCNVTQALAAFLPALYLPHYAHSNLLGSSSGTVLLATLRVSGIVGKILFGALSDSLSPHLIGCVTNAVASISVLGIWGGLGSQGLSALMVFASLFGMTAEAWTSIYFPVIGQQKVDENTTLTMYGALSITRGVGNILAGPISSGLMRTKLTMPSGTGFAALNNSYASLIMFCGIGMAGTAVIEALLYLSHWTRTKSSSGTLA